MFKLKKLVALLLCLVMLSSMVLTSCNTGTNTPDDSSDKPTTESTQGGENTEGGDSTGGENTTEGEDSAEGGDSTEGNENNTENKKQIPIYQGMTITSSNSSTMRLSAANYRSSGIALLSSNNGNNGNHYGHYKGDCTDNKDELDNNNPYPDNSEKIEDEIQSSLEVIGSTKEIYYTTPNQYIYINIHISNPDKYEILSFTLNGEKYSSYMFEQGSTLETLILKVNVGNTSGIIEYTIDQIKYVDGTEIKDVKIDGEKTVKAGVKINNQVSANISNVNIGTNSISFAAKITDNDALLAYSNGAIKAVLYDGEQLVATKDIAIGDNNIVFDTLTTNSIYQYAIVAFYDDLSGNGVEAHVLTKNAFSTNPVVLFDNIAVDKTNINFGLKWDESVANKTLTSLKLYRGETLVQNLAIGATSVSGLLSGETYTLIAEYQDLGKTESITLEFTTLMKEKYVISLTNPTNTQSSIGFEINEIDVDNVGSVTKIELYKGNQFVKEAESINVRSFDGLLSNTVYTVKITYTYDLNNGTGEQTAYETLDITTGEKTTPTISLINPTKTQTSVGFEVSESDADNVGAVTKIELVHANGTVDADNLDQRTFANLLSNISYTVKITYVYNLNDGNGDHTVTKELTITTDAKATPTVSVINPTKTQTSVGFEISETDADNIGSVTKIELYKGNQLVKEAKSLDARSFDGLLSNTTYTLKITYTYDLNDGMGARSIIKESSITTLAKSAPTIAINNASCDKNSIYLEISKNDRDNTITEVEVDLLIDGVVVKNIKLNESCTIADLLYDTQYSVRVTAYYDLNDGNSVYSKSVSTTITTPYYVDAQGVSYKTYIDGTAEVTGVTDGALEITIPEYVNGYKVTSIQSKAFYNKKITSVVIPGSVETIGASAFEQCYDLTKVTLNEGTKTIKTKAFWKCTPDWIVIPNSVSVIESKALYVYWNYLGSSDNVVDCGGKIYCYVASRPTGWARDFVADYNGNYIGRGLTDRKICFWDFDKFVEEDDILYAVSLDRDISEIVKALQYKNSYVLPDKIENCTVIGIAPYAFYRITDNANKPMSLSLPKHLEYINYAAFSSNYFEWETNITFPETLKYIDAHAFSNIYNGFWSIEFYGLEINIASRAFYGSGITCLNIPLNATGTIDSNAFYYCDYLEYVNIPYQMTIYDEAFRSCSQVKFACIVDRRPSHWGDEWEDGIPVSWSSYVDEQGIVYKINERITYNDQATMTVIDFWDKDATEIIIPNEVFGLAVWMIGEEAFWDTNLYKIYVPKNVHVIAERAFDSYASVEITYEFGSDFFRNYGYVTVDGMIFSYDQFSSTTTSWLMEYIKPGNGTRYELLRNYYDEETYTYYDLYFKPVTTAPIDLVIPSTVYGLSVAGIYNSVFYGTEFNSVTIPNTITTIACDAFYGCTILTSITVEDGNTKYHSAGNCLIETESKTLIKGCNNSIIPTDGSVTSIAEGAFRGCTALTSITIPDSITSIGTAAFYGCTGLTSIVIPNSVTTIGYEGFRNCSGLTSVTLSNNITTIDGYTFYGCRSLTSITIPDSVTTIRFYAFKYCTGLTNVTIPNTVTDIDSGAFEGCINLTSVTLPTNITEISWGTFEGCSSLTSITIPYGVTSIGNSAFRDCVSLTTIIIPNSVTSIGNYAFTDCSGLVSVTLSDGLTNIGEAVFSGCSSLTNIIIPNSVTTIGFVAFSGCSSLESIIIPNSVTTIGSSAFSGCKSLESIIIPNSVTNFEGSVFQGCTNLTNITIPSSIKTITSQTFYGCTGLTNITIPDNITKIGHYAFSYCSNLTRIDYNGTIEQWSDIYLEEEWDRDTIDYTVYCTDGTIAKDGTVTYY